MFSRGSVTLGRIGGAPIRVHWSAPLGALLFGQLQIVPGFWLAFLGLLLVHELGHALVVRAVGGRVRDVLVTGFGGECAYDGVTDPVRRAWVAWGGVAAQLAVFALAAALLFALGPATTPFVADLGHGLTTYNLLLIALNLIPVRPLDGYEAWRLFPLLRQRRSAPPPRPHSPFEGWQPYTRRPSAGTPAKYDVQSEMKKLRDYLDGHR